MTEFELGGYAFKTKPLKPKQSLKGIRIIGEAIGPLLAAAANEKPEAKASKTDQIETAGKLLAGLDGLESLRVLFAGVTTVQTEEGTGFVPLSSVEEAIFSRKPTLLLAWLVAALKAEYADFLSPEGQSLLRGMGLS